MSKARDIADLDFNAPDIDGGNIDGAVIGGTTPAAGSFSGLTVEDNSPFINISNTGENAGGIKMYDSGGAATQYFNLTYDSGASNTVGFDTGASGEYAFSVNGASMFNIASTGAATFSSNIATTAGHLALGQTTTFPSTGFISHTNGFLYAEGGSNGIILRSASGGAQMMKIQSSEVAVNDDGADIDFRVESENNANAFRVDAGDDQVRTDAVFVHDADGSNQPFYITRSGGLDQALKVTMDDNNVMLTSVQDETSGANFIFYSTNATTTNLKLLQLDYSAGSVFNEDGVNYQHVRMESDTDTHAFYLNAVNGYIGMGAGASPTQPLSVGARTGANLNYINGTANSVSTASGILISDTITSESDVGFGLLLANNANNANARSPVIGFSALSASNGYQHLYAAINARKISNGADTNWNTGQLEFSTGSGTGPHIRMKLDRYGGLITTPTTAGHTVFNEDGADADFRVESVGVSNMLQVDADSNGVGIRTNGDGNQSLKIKSTGATGNMTLIEDEGVGDGSYTPYYQYKVAYIAGNSSNTQLTIPFNARSYNQTGYIKIRVIPALHNLATPANVATAEFALSMAYPTTVSVGAVLSSSGNYASVTNNTSNQIIITFSNAYSNATMSGAFVHIEFFSQQGTQGAPNWNSIAFN